MVFLVSFNYVVIALLSVLFIWYVDRWKRRKLFPCSETVPGPYALPVIGAAYNFFGEPTNVMTVILKMIDSYPDVVKFWMGYKLLYFLKKPEHLEMVINNPRALNRDYFYEQLTLVLGEGLITSGGVKWKRHRKLINPSFSQRTLNNFVGLFNETAERLVIELEKNIGKRNVPLNDIIGSCIVELNCRATMGVVINVESIDKSIGEVLEKLNDLFSEKSLKLWNHVDAIWYLSGKKAIFQNYIKRLQSIVNEVIQKKLFDEELKKLKMEEDVMANDRYTPERRAFLDMLITNTDLDEKELRDEVNTFLVAATRTTSNALTAVFAILGIYPYIQEKVYQEVMEVIGVEGEILPEHLHRMELTDRVIRETLRLFPAGPIVTRYVSGDLNLGNNITIPEGASVAIPILYIHRCSEFWEDPMKFDPDRFLPENVGKRHPLTYFPFSQGLRSCIGSRYAMMVMKIAIAVAIRRMRFFSEYKSVEEIELKMGILLRMKDGPKVWIERR